MSKVFLLLQKGLSERENDLQVFQQICFTKYFSNRQMPVMTFSSITLSFKSNPLNKIIKNVKETTVIRKSSDIILLFI
jgi:hypothetical protein